VWGRLLCFKRILYTLLKNVINIVQFCEIVLKINTTTPARNLICSLFFHTIVPLGHFLKSNLNPSHILYIALNSLFGSKGRKFVSAVSLIPRTGFVVSVKLSLHYIFFIIMYLLHPLYEPILRKNLTVSELNMFFFYRSLP
jgi:hypothetical protein